MMVKALVFAFIPASNQEVFSLWTSHQDSHGIVKARQLALLGDGLCVTLKSFSLVRIAAF
jgi:hypothetical protein